MVSSISVPANRLGTHGHLDPPIARDASIDREQRAARAVDLVYAVTPCCRVLRPMAVGPTKPASSRIRQAHGRLIAPVSPATTTARRSRLNARVASITFVPLNTAVAVSLAYVSLLRPPPVFTPG